MDGAIGAGQISAKIPFIRREAVRALRGEYAAQGIGLREIDRTIRAAMNVRQPHPFEESELRQAISVTQSIYRRSVFLKVGWGTYPNQIGHTTSMGCFRCHDEGHKTTEGARHPAGLRAVSHDRVTKKKSVESARYLG